METTKQLKEEKRQAYLKPNQINTNLIKKLDKLPTEEIVMAIKIEKKHTWIVCDSGRTYKSIHKFINNELVSYIEFGHETSTKSMFTYRVEQKHHELLKEIAIYLNEKVK